jgi:hypothetical protein
MQRFNNPTTDTNSFHTSDVYFTLEHIKCITGDEKWRTIPDFTRYEASTGGRIRDMYTCKIVQQNFNGRQQYYRVTVTGDDGKRGNQFVHRLVAKAFSWARPLTEGDGWVIDHINHNGEDNRPCNLRAISTTANANNKRNQVRYEFKGQLLPLALIFAQRYGVRITSNRKTLPAYSRVNRLLKEGHTLDYALLSAEAKCGLPQFTHPTFLIEPFPDQLAA